MTNEAFNPQKLKLHVLRRASEGRLPLLLGPGGSEVLICSELTDSGHLQAWITPGIDGKPCMVLDARITSLGEKYLEEFERNNLVGTDERSTTPK